MECFLKIGCAWQPGTRPIHWDRIKGEHTKAQCVKACMIRAVSDPKYRRAVIKNKECYCSHDAKAQGDFFSCVLPKSAGVKTVFTGASGAHMFPEFGACSI